MLYSGAAWKRSIFKDIYHDCDACRLVSEWLNSDQNQNAGNSEAQLMKTIQTCVQGMLKTAPHVKLNAVVANVVQSSVVKLSTNTVGGLTRWVLDHGVDQYVDEFLTFHCNSVSPVELACSPSWFDEVAKSIPKKYPLVKLGLAINQYNPEAAEQKLRPSRNSNLRGDGG